MTSSEGPPRLKVLRYEGSIVVRQKEKSLTLPFPQWIFIARPQQIARHERFIEDKLTTFSMTNGWKGSPLAVTSFSQRLLEATRKPGVYLLDGLQYGELGILDGHHRHEVASRTGGVVVAQLFPMDTTELIIQTWDGTGKPLSKDDVKTVLLDPDLYLPPRATRFRMVEDNGETDGLPAFQPHVTLSFDNLDGLIL